MKYCLDTNIVIDILHGDQELTNALDELQGWYCINPVILSELYRGAYLTKQNKGMVIESMQRFVKKAQLLLFDESACKIFGETYAHLKNKGKPTNEMDLMIASIALSHDVILVTRDKKGFNNIPGLKLMAF